MGGLALVLGGLLYAYVLWGLNNSCTGELCGLARLPVAIMLGGLALLAAALAGLFAVVAALAWHDRIAAAGLAFVVLLGCFAAYALYYNGSPGHPVVTAIYGFSPTELTTPWRPQAMPLSVALMAMLPVAALLYGLCPARARRAAALAALFISLGLLLAIRVTT